MAENSKAIVKIGDETYSILELPPTGTVVVEEQKRILLGSVDLESLVSDLGKVGNFVRLAYNGVAGYTDLQIEIRKIGYNVTKLCDKSAVTVTKFKQASGSILEDLQGTYQFLLDGFEKMALVTLQSVTEVAKDMVVAAEQLHEDFNEESQRVERALENTKLKKGSEEKRKKTLADEAKNLEVQKKASERERVSAEEDFKTFEEKYTVAQAKEEQFEAKATNPLKAVANAVFSIFTGGRKVFDTDADLEVSREARAEKIMFLQEMKKQREVRSKALKDIAEFTTKIANCQDDSELADVAIGALHSAVGGLKKLSSIMLKAALFWKQMQVHCEQLAKQKMQTMIKTAMEMPKEERLELWTSKSFKIQAVQYYAKWVALDGVCAIYMGKIKETQGGLYAYLEENLTLEQARRKVPELAKAFSKELAMEQKAIEEKNSADAAEMKELTKKEK